VVDGGSIAEVILETDLGPASAVMATSASVPVGEVNTT
jgi:hypothetical protein